MAIGYGTIILRKFESYFEDMITGIQNTYQLFEDTEDSITILNYDGDHVLVTIPKAAETFKEQKLLSIRFVNDEKSAITLSISEIDNYLIEEHYSMDELLSDEEEEELLNYLKSRFNRLLDDKIGIGFVFDTEGYSEDYILIPPPNWQNAHECWRKLMGG